MNFFWISLSLALGLLAGGCSQGETTEPDVTDLSIRLRAGLIVTTKAAGPVNEGTAFTAATAGWESSTGSADYGTQATWMASSDITASAAAGNITLTPQPNYNQNSAVVTYIKAWYPAGTLGANGVVTFGGVSDGTTDVLLAPEVNGSAVNMDAKTLVFEHPLTQLKFKVVGNAAFGATTSINSIKVKEAELPTGINLVTDVVTYAAPAEVAVPGINGTQMISTTAALAGDPVMVKPFAGKTCKIDVTTSVTTYNDVVVTIDGDANFIPGKVYTVTLNFAGLNITTSASVTPWDETGTGSGDITVH